MDESHYEPRDPRSLWAMLAMNVQDHERRLLKVERRQNLQNVVLLWSIVGLLIGVPLGWWFAWWMGW